jgi:hypothetical protein
MIRCPMCDSEVNKKEACRGILINKVARLGGEIVSIKERLKNIKNDEAGKQLKESFENKISNLEFDLNSLKEWMKNNYC